MKLRKQRERERERERVGRNGQGMWHAWERAEIKCKWNFGGKT